MDKIFELVKKPAKICTISCFIAAAVFSLLVNIGNFGGGFMPVVGRLFILIIEVALWACIPVFILLKKEDIAKKFFLPILVYWYLNIVITFFVDTAWARPNVNGVFVASGVFEFLLGLAFLAAVALYVISKIKNKDIFEQLAFIIFGASFVIFFVVFILRMVGESQWNAPWNDYFNVILNFLILPVGMFFACMFFYPPKTGEEKVVAIEYNEDSNSSDSLVIEINEDKEKNEEVNNEYDEETDTSEEDKVEEIKEEKVNEKREEEIDVDEFLNSILEEKTSDLSNETNNETTVEVVDETSNEEINEETKTEEVVSNEEDPSEPF